MWRGRRPGRLGRLIRGASTPENPAIHMRPRPSGPTPMQIRHAAPGDAAPVAEIYNPYVTDTCITFATEPVTAAEMATRIRETADAGLPWLVAIDQGSLVGDAYASRWKGRCAYRYSVE